MLEYYVLNIAQSGVRTKSASVSSVRLYLFRIKEMS
jgi:hypothetical protein